MPVHYETAVEPHIGPGRMHMRRGRSEDLSLDLSFSMS